MLEQESSLADCEHAELISRNKEQKASLQLLQCFRAASTSYLASPSDEALMAMHGDLTVLREMVSKTQRQLHVTLEKLYLHGQFLHMVENDGVGQAIAELGLDDPSGKLRAMYTKLCQEVPSTKPERGLQWAETDLLEMAAKHCLRKCPMTAASRDHDLNRMHTFFQKYDAAIAGLSSVSAPVKQGARALLSLSAAASRSQVSASEVGSSYRSITDDAKDGLCKSMSLYRAGKELLLHAEGVVTRHVGDVLGDKCLQDVLQWLAGFDAGQEESMKSVDTIAEKAAMLDELALKLNGAFNHWSDVRLEEQLNSLQEALTGIVKTVLAYEMSFASDVVAQVWPSIKHMWRQAKRCRILGRGLHSRRKFYGVELAKPPGRLDSLDELLCKALREDQLRPPPSRRARKPAGRRLDEGPLLEGEHRARRCDLGADAEAHEVVAGLADRRKRLGGSGPRAGTAPL